MKRCLVLLVIFLGVLKGSDLFAHHSVSAKFDTGKLVPLTGVITKVNLINPHITLLLDVKDSEGKVTTWNMELAPPNALGRRVDLKVLQVGLQVTVESWLAKDGTKEASARTVILPDGQRLSVGDNWFDVQMLPRP